MTQVSLEPLALKEAFAKFGVPDDLFYHSLLVWAKAGHDYLSLLSRGRDQGYNEAKQKDQ